MTSILKVDTIQDADGNNIINESGNTITIGASGDTTNIIGTLQNDGAAVGGVNTPIVRAFANANQNMSNATTTKVEFGGETFDTGNNFASSRFTPTTSGKYLITVQVNTTYSGSAPNNEYLYLKKNGTTIMTGNFRGSGHGYGFNFVADIVEFNGSSDYVEVFAYGDNTTNYIIEGGTGGYNSNFTATKLIE
jgi:hypothetical protein